MRDCVQPGPEIQPKLHDLPEECIREIILRITDYRDLESSSAAWTLMAALVSEQRVWRELTHFHFSVQQIDLVQKKLLVANNQYGESDENKIESRMKKSDGTIDWQSIYHALRRYFLCSLMQLISCFVWMKSRYKLYENWLDVPKHSNIIRD